MANPKTWELLASIATCLQAITVANGFHTDAGTAVTREPAQVPDDQGMVLAVVLESMRRPEDPAIRAVGYTVNVAVLAKVGTGMNDAQQRLHELIDDITRAMTDRRDQFQVGAQYPRFLEARVIPPAEGMKWIGADVRFSAHVRP